MDRLIRLGASRTQGDVRLRAPFFLPPARVVNASLAVRFAQRESPATLKQSVLAIE
ncbi:hypothetical protein ML401_38990 [Bradyrhizobium sp. 62B]|nr:hypothetical protein ML401_38990 [Bradyrhizobium sp. 62B]